MGVDLFRVDANMNTCLSWYSWKIMLNDPNAGYVSEQIFSTIKIQRSKCLIADICCMS